MLLETLIQNGLVIIFPVFSTISLETATMPTESDETITMCCEAAFTDKCLDEFSQDNINGHHVCNGIYYEGSPSALPSDNNGCFFWSEESGFSFSVGEDIPAAMDKAVQEKGMAFMQHLMYLDGEYQDAPWSRKPTDVNVYRALCDIGGRLCIIQSVGKVEFSEFEKKLSEAKVTSAIYLDMGDRWNFGFYREGSAAQVKYLFPQNREKNTNTTNWITFRK